MQTGSADPQNEVLLSAFGKTESWIFDLDNTLYPAHSDLFAQVSEKMTTYIREKLVVTEEAAQYLRESYYKTYGTTLRGLMVEHGIDPHDFLDHVHDIDHSPLEPDPALGAALAELPGRKFIFTNGSRGHAENVIGRLGIDGHFEDVFDIVASEFTPKPQAGPYRTFIERNGIDPQTAVMFEDIPRNLEVPKTLGMGTVLVVPRIRETNTWRTAHEDEGREDGHLDHVTEDLADFLVSVVETLQTRPGNTA